MLLKSRVPLTWFRACFLPGGVKDLSAPRYKYKLQQLVCVMENKKMTEYSELQAKVA